MGIKRSARGAVVAFTAVALTMAAVPSASAVPSVPGTTNVAGGDIWMPNYGTGSVLRLDPSSLELKAELKNTGDHPMVAKMNADGTKLFVGNFGPFDFSVTVIDTVTNQVIKKIPTFLTAWATITMSMDRKRLYVPTAGSVVHVVNTDTLEVERTIPIVLPPSIAHIEVSPDEKWIYNMSGPGPITRYSTETGLPDGDILLPVGVAPGWGALSTDGKRLYSINFFSGVSLIDTEGWRVVKNKMISPFGAGPLSGTLSPDESELWISNYTDSSVLVLDAHTLEEKRRFDTNGAAIYISFADDGKAFWLTTIDDGPFNPFVSLAPLTGSTTREKHGAWFSGILGSQTRVTLYDTETLSRRQEYSTTGAMVAGVFPPNAPSPLPAPTDFGWEGRNELPWSGAARSLNGSVADGLGSLAAQNLAIPFPSSEGE